MNGTFTEVGDGFDPQVGFLTRRDFRNVDLGLFRTIRLGANPARLLEIRPHTSYRAYWTLGGFQETGFWPIDSHWAWRAAHEIHTGMNITREGVVDAFEIYPGIVVPPGVYDHREAMIVAFTRRAAPVSVESRVNAGGFFDCYSGSHFIGPFEYRCGRTGAENGGWVAFYLYEAPGMLDEGTASLIYAPGGLPGDGCSNHLVGFWFEKYSPRDTDGCNWGVGG